LSSVILTSALLVAGTLLLVLGTGLQAYRETRKFEALWKIVRHGVPEQLKKLLDNLELRGIAATGAIVVGLGAIVIMFRLLRQLFSLIKATKAAKPATPLSATPSEDERRKWALWEQIVLTRNWTVVMFGASIVFAGELVELIRRAKGN
jgi:hypothetical protein